MPQSGVAKAVVKVDGKLVDEANPGCTTENCAVSREWNLDSSQYPAGTHSVEVIATDAVGNTTTQTVNIELQPALPPNLTLSGSMTEQSTLGVSRPRYSLKVSASSEGGTNIVPVSTYVSSFGSLGAGIAQFNSPRDIAVDAKGNLWVSDRTNNRIEKFNEKGQYLSQFGTKGTGDGQLSGPGGIAIDAKGDVWVADTGNNRIEEFSESGSYLAKFGSAGAAAGQFASPEGITIDFHGNIWVADTLNNRVQVFTEAGAFVKAIGSKGSGVGQFEQPRDIAIGPNGWVWITDWANNRIDVYLDSGTVLGSFGTAGSGYGQFMHPDSIAIYGGSVYVTDTENGRIEQFSEQSVVHLARIGAKGIGSGQFLFGAGGGLAFDARGDIRAVDANSDRVQDWRQVGGPPSFAASFGALGTGSGQFSHASDVATDLKGNVWSTDSTLNRIEEFNEKGEYVAKFGTTGSGNGQFNDPTALAINAKGNIWITDTNNNRVEVLNEKGEFVKVVGFKGTGNGGFTSPEGIAIDSKGNVWVADRGNGRLEKFSEAGTFLKAAGTKGTGTGQLGEPMGISVGPADNVWVADWTNNRVEEFSEAGAYLRQFGTEGTGNSQLSNPAAVSVDGGGNVWVLDVGNNRVEKFSESGEYLGQFGSKGSGSGQFTLSRPAGLGRDARGYLWTTNVGSYPIEKWARSGTRSGVSVEVTVDGNPVDSTGLGCIGEKCSASPEWTLNSSAFTAGKHVVLVKASDGLGRSTTKTMTIEVQPDGTKPTLEASGSLFEAPMGWVEQQNYSVTGKAEDGGSGVIQMKLMIDGTQAGISTQGCLNGGCALSHTFTIDTASYPGGAHEAELIAIDGAGNTTTRKWTINVDPEGKVSVLEAEQTLEAADATSEATVVAPTSEVLEPEQIEGGDNPGLKVSGSEITSTGVPDTTTMTTDPEGGFTVHSPEEATTITPVISESSSSISVAEGLAGVAANRRGGHVIGGIHHGSSPSRPFVRRPAQKPIHGKWVSTMARR